MFGYDLGIDIGTSNIVITIPSNNKVVINEPSYVAYIEETEKIIYAGRRAYYLQGREPKGVAVVQPINDGVISNFELCEQMIKHFINKVIKKSIFKPRVVASVPALATDVEKRTLISVIINAGARSVCLLETPLCAAFGAGVDPAKPDGVFVIDIGGGTTDMAVVSQGTMSQTETVKIGGNDFDDAIIKFLKEKYELEVGSRTAEEIKKTIGCAVPRIDDVKITAKGRSTVDGMPVSVEISSNEIHHAIKPALTELVSAAQVMFERTSPQLVADLVNNEVLLTGGSAGLYGLEQLFSEALGLSVRVVDDGGLAAAKGAAVALNKMHILDNYGYRYQTKEDARTR